MIPDLHDLAHVAGWEPNELVGPVLYRSCTHNDKCRIQMI